MAHGDPDVVTGLVGWLRRRRDCEFSPGLTEAELDRAERVFGVSFPPLWRAVLARVHPVAAAGSGAHYPDWRPSDESATRALVEAPIGGLLFDVEQNGFWWHDWGEPPAEVAERVAQARRRLSTMPRLTPLLGHLYVAETDDSPVFGIVQADLYVPALSLADLIDGRGQDAVPPERYPIGTVPFWSELHAYSQLGHLDGEHGRFGRLATGGL